MKTNKKLNLADFKAKADKVESKEILNQMQGGASDCHGLKLKPWYDIALDIVFGPLHP